MTREEIDRQNAAYHNLPIEIMPRFNELVDMPMKLHPLALSLRIRERVDREMLCMEVILAAVADYLRPDAASTKTLPVHLL